MLARVTKALSGLSQATAIVLAVCFLGIFGLLDYLTGYEISFAVFYLAPVSIAAWYASRQWSLALAVASSLIWYIAELGAGYPYSHFAIPIWNAFVRLAFFVIVALLLSEIRRNLLHERKVARTDPLTGLLNRRAFLERLDHDLGISDRSGEPLTLIYVDLDDFKLVNDTWGHAAGDRILQSVASRLSEATRRADTVARLGGDEFALILPATDLAGARNVIDKIEKSLGSEDTTTRPVSCSIGSVVFSDPPLSATDAIDTADHLMYDAKRNGKRQNVVAVFRRTDPEPASTSCS